MKTIIQLSLSITLLLLLGCEEEKTPLPLPAPPTSLIGTTISDSEIQLDWTDNSDNEEGFILSRRGDGYRTDRTIAADITTYVDTGLISLLYYSYEVYAFNNDNPTGESAYSGNIWTFGVPAVETSWPSYVASNAIGSAIYMLDDAGQPILEHGVIWDTSDDPDTTVVTKTKQGPIDEKEFSLYDITGLESDTYYYIRGYAINSIGIGYSSSRRLKTFPE